MVIDAGQGFHFLSELVLQPRILAPMGLQEFDDHGTVRNLFVARHVNRACTAAREKPLDLVSPIEKFSAPVVLFRVAAVRNDRPVK